jgi:electron transfer flavoprotein alpha subunit
MKEEAQSAQAENIWVLARKKFGIFEESTLGLIGEAHRLIGVNGKVTAIVIESITETELNVLGQHGADRILCTRYSPDSRRNGEFFERVLSSVARKENPSFILMAHGPETMDLAPRLAASLAAPLATRVVDLKMDHLGKVTAVRPVSGGYLFQEVELLGVPPYIVSFLPAVLTMGSRDESRRAEIIFESIEEEFSDLKTRVVGVAEPEAEEVDLEDADIVVSGGRGVGKGEAFKIITELAQALGGSVGCTRPVVDWQVLPFERQIGQTGRTVSSRLLFACGISGANEYTAGMEKSQLVIAVNNDPTARIFRFADLGVVADLHELLPLLIKRIKEIKETR